MKGELQLMNTHERSLLNKLASRLDEAYILLHQLIGAADAAQDYKPTLQLIFGSADRGNPTQAQKETSFALADDLQLEQGFVSFTDEEIKQMPKKNSKTYYHQPQALPFTDSTLRQERDHLRNPIPQGRLRGLRLRENNRACQRKVYRKAPNGKAETPKRGACYSLNV